MYMYMQMDLLLVQYSEISLQHMLKFQHDGAPPNSTFDLYSPMSTSVL